MKVTKKFAKLHEVKRHRHHPLMHKIHRKHRLSYSTIFYMKEYCSRSHTVATILKESLKIILIAALLSSFGGIGIEHTKEKFIAIIPLIIMLPALNDMIGDFGSIVSSKFTTMIYTGKVSLKKGLMKSGPFRKLVKNVFAVAMMSSLYVGAASYAMSLYSGFVFEPWLFARVMATAVLCTLILVTIIFVVSVACGIYVYRKKNDPNNFLIPITTAVADFGSMLLFAYMVVRLF